MLRCGNNLCIVVRNIVFFLISKKLLITKLRLAFLNLGNPLVGDYKRYEIRLREIAVILCIFLGTHCMRRFFVIIPTTGFLHNASSHLKKFDLTLTLAFDGMGDRLK